MVEVELLVGLAGATAKSPGDSHHCDAAEAERMIAAGVAKPMAKAGVRKVETATRKPAESRDGLPTARKGRTGADVVAAVVDGLTSAAKRVRGRK